MHRVAWLLLLVGCVQAPDVAAPPELSAYVARPLHPQQLRHPGSADFLHPTDATARARSAHYLEPRAILSDHPGATAGPHAAHAIEMAGRVIEETGASVPHSKPTGVSASP